MSIQNIVLMRGTLQNIIILLFVAFTCVVYPPILGSMSAFYFYSCSGLITLIG